MKRRSAGLLMYRIRDGRLEVLLVHPGGPFWAKKDDGAWSIPKGEYEDGEEPRVVAMREFAEELGSPPPEGDVLHLGDIAQPSRKIVTAYALEGNFDPETLRSNRFELEWPPKSGRRQSFPEVDRAQWFTVNEARQKILPGQAPFLDRLVEKLGSG